MFAILLALVITGYQSVETSMFPVPMVLIIYLFIYFEVLEIAHALYMLGLHKPVTIGHLVSHAQVNLVTTDQMNRGCVF